MPSAPPRPCAETMCPALITGTEGRCPAHRKEKRRQVDERRGSREERGYGYEWRTYIRPSALAREPLCRFCAEVDRVKAADQVDHIDGNSSNNDPSNLRSLCRSCHSRHTAREQGFARKRKR